jgi:hypothetical protein
MRCSKTGRVLELLSPAPAPYQLWSCDEWRCEGCGATVLAGYGRGPMVDRGADPSGYQALRAYEAKVNNVVMIEV